MKSKLPFGKKKQIEGEEFDEEVDEEAQSAHQEDATDSTDISEMDMDEEDVPQNKSLIHKLKSKIQSLQKGKKSSNDEDLEEGDVDEDDEAAKKKKRSKILQGVIIGGIVVFLASDYIFPPEDEVPAVQLKPRPKPKPRKPVAGGDPTATETPAETPAETPTDTATTEAPTETPADTAVTETPAETPAETPTETPVEEPDDTATVETPPEEPTDTTTVETPTESPVDVTSTETPAETASETPDNTETTPVDTTVNSGLGEPGENDPGSVMSTDSVDGSETIPGTEDNLTDQILEDLEKQAKSTEPVQTRKQYVAPPDYEYRGRGLVYNCTGKHWACVDAPSYKTCEDNSSSVKYLNKATECYPFNVYETAKGCESMQNRMVSSSAKTSFCNE